jgi:hypothetical protein
LFVALVASSLEALAVERVEVDAVGLVGDEQVEYSPDEGETAALAGEAAHYLGPAFDLTERALEQIGSWYERWRMPPRALDRDVAAVERFGPGEYGATVRDRGIREQTQAGQAGVRSMRFERELVLGRPCDSPGCAVSANP